MSYCSLPRVKLHKKDEIEKLNNLTSNYSRLYVTRGRHNQASFCRKLDPIEKSVWRTENPLALLFKDVANFDAQNPVIGSLLRELDLGKKSTNSDLIKKLLSKALDINDTIFLQRFKKFKETSINYNYNYDDDGNNDNNINNSKNNNYNNISLGPPPSPIKLGDIFETSPPSFNFNNVNLQQEQQQ